MSPIDQPQTSTPIKTGRQEERKLQVTVEAVEPSKIEAGADVKVFNYSDRCYSDVGNRIYPEIQQKKLHFVPS